MKNINRLSIYCPSKGLVKPAAGFWAIALAQAVILTLPVYAADSAAAGSLPGAVLPGVQSPLEAAPPVSIPANPPASIMAAPPASITAAPPASAVRLEQSVQATMVPTMSGEAISSDIDNFQVVSTGLWRGALPSAKAFAKLGKSGVKTIVDLRYDGPGVAAEARLAQQYGISYVNIPLGFKNPSLGDVARFLAIVAKPANQPVFVHCRQGADRTGTVVGVFRILHDHWSFREAYNEMRLHHFKPWLGNMKSLVARCELDPKVSKELNEMASKLEGSPLATKVSVRSQPSSI